MMYDGPGWQLELAENWEWEEEEDCVAFFNPDGVGTLEISTAHKEEGEIDADELDELAADCAPEDVPLEKTSIEQWVGKAASFEDEGEAWRIWCLRRAGYALFITYSCEQADAGQEDGEVDQMIRSLDLQAIN